MNEHVARQTLHVAQRLIAEVEEWAREQRDDSMRSDGNSTPETRNDLRQACTQVSLDCVTAASSAMKAYHAIDRIERAKKAFEEVE